MIPLLRLWVRVQGHHSQQQVQLPVLIWEAHSNNLGLTNQVLDSLNNSVNLITLALTIIR
jgi:hypothetical protein